MTTQTREYFAPGSVDDALRVLSERPRAHLLAGGTDLLNDLRHGVIEPGDVVDLAGVAELGGLDEAPDGVRIGATVTMRELLAAPLGDRLRALREAADLLGGRQIQAAATVGGNLCQGSPAAEVATALLAHGALVDVAGPRGRRTMPVAELFAGPRRTTLAPEEILVAIRVGVADAGWSSAYRRIDLRRSVDIAIVSASAALDIDAGVVRSARVAVGAARPVPFLVPEAAAALEGVAVGDEAALAAAAGRAAEAARSASSPITDVRAGAEYRRAMVGVVVERAVRAAVEEGR
ncbi:FAD binding domain-containing protein [Nocardioides sp. LMS-CY]|uniref:FAD binding domain-containing protein n=1 Tax=Nocardioides sp. (strain LMS-CY) TaxID=2840457 RepID=UPI001C003EE9|nr:FAD binding domain-containing protein [Nocardioides sp. LMS-CY]QWF21285.1 FAD binding domain-containing protein [Nocardioides sp. LMS-CY]